MDTATARKSTGPNRKQFAFGNIYLGLILTIVKTLYMVSISFLINLYSLVIGIISGGKNFKPLLLQQQYSNGSTKPQNSPKPAPIVSNLKNLVEKGPLAPGVATDLRNSAEFPAWFNPHLATIGQLFAQKHLFGIYYSFFLYFIFFVGDLDIRRLLLDSKKSNTPEKSLQRYITNFLHVEMWFLENPAASNSTTAASRANQNLFKSLNKVLSRHRLALLRSKTQNEILKERQIPEPRGVDENPHQVDQRIWKAFRLDLDASPYFSKLNSSAAGADKGRVGNALKFNQYAMSIGLFLHFGFPVLCPEKVFIYGATEQEFMGYLHLWAFIGRAVGVQDEFNICLHSDLQTARKYLREFVEQILVPILYSVDYETKVMFEALFKGLNNGFGSEPNPTRTARPNMTELFLLRLLEDILEIPCPNMRAVLTKREKFRAVALNFIKYPAVFSVLSPFLNQFVKNLIHSLGEAQVGVGTSDWTLVAEKGFV